MKKVEILFSYNCCWLSSGLAKKVVPSKCTWPWEHFKKILCHRFLITTLETDAKRTIHTQKNAFNEKSSIFVLDSAPLHHSSHHSLPTLLLFNRVIDPSGIKNTILKRKHIVTRKTNLFYYEQVMQYISWHLCESKKCTATYYPLKTKAYYVHKD